MHLKEWPSNWSPSSLETGLGFARNGHSCYSCQAHVLCLSVWVLLWRQHMRQYFWNPQSIRLTGSWPRSEHLLIIFFQLQWAPFLTPSLSVCTAWVHWGVFVFVNVQMKPMDVSIPGPLEKEIGDHLTSLNISLPAPVSLCVLVLSACFPRLWLFYFYFWSPVYSVVCCSCFVNVCVFSSLSFLHCRWSCVCVSENWYEVFSKCVRVLVAMCQNW